MFSEKLLLRKQKQKELRIQRKIKQQLKKLEKLQQNNGQDKHSVVKTGSTTPIQPTDKQALRVSTKVKQQKLKRKRTGKGSQNRRNKIRTTKNRKGAKNRKDKSLNRNRD